MTVKRLVHFAAFVFSSQPSRSVGYIVAIVVSVVMTSDPTGAFEPATHLRRPVSIKWIDSGRLAVANQRGSISVIDVDDRRVMNEISLGGRLADVHVVNERTIAVLDEATHDLVVVSQQDGEWKEASRTKLSHTPVAFALDSKGEQTTVTSLWSQRLTLVDFTSPHAPTLPKSIDLPFAPRLHRALNDTETIVAGAFGGDLAIVDLATGNIVRHRALKASHNLAGIAFAGSSTLRIPHMMLNHEQATTGSNVHWGDVMSNVVRTLDLSWFRSSAEEETTAADLYYLGHPDDATGDPTHIRITKTGRQIIAFAGINQIGISDVGANNYRRIQVGQRPTAFALDKDEKLLFVANRFDDSISIVDVTRRRLIDSISLGPTPDLQLADQGEILFYDSTLSSDGWFSCHSCHTDGHSNGQLSDTFGDNYQGTPKRVLTLLGTADTGPWAWTGKVETLDRQIRKSVETTMRGDTPTPQQVAALASYLRTLRAAPAIDVARGKLDHKAIGRGQQVFEAIGCVECHQPPSYTSTEVYDVGLQDAEGNRQFNPPSLIGVSQRPRLLHDRSATEYREALQIHPFGDPVELTAQQWLDLTRFLDSL